jgi:hypothetical protein
MRLSDSSSPATYAQFTQANGVLSFNADAGNSQSNSVMKFLVDSSEAMRIDASGNLLVGKSGSSFGTDGFQVNADGQIWATNASASVTAFNRRTTDGAISVFYKDGSTVGSIGSYSGVVSYLVLDPRANGAGLMGLSNEIAPANESGNPSDAAKNLGSSSRRFKDLYLSGGAYLGGTGSANKLDYYEQGTWAPQISFGGTNATTTVTRARYVRIGNWVEVSGTIRCDSGPASGAFQIGDLPFTPSGNVETIGSIICNLVNTETGTVNIATYLYNSDTLINVYASKDNTAWYALSNTHVSNGDSIIFTHSYTTS